MTGNAGDDEHGWDLQVPFIVCQSEGGPYDDDAFVAGYECGELNCVLLQGPDLVEQPVHTPSLPQVDLLAMSHGYVVTTIGPLDEESRWTTVQLTRASAD